MITIKTMLEAMISLSIAIIVFAFGYGKLNSDVKNNKQVSDDRYKLLQKDLDSIKDDVDQTKDNVGDIKVTLQVLKTSAEYIVKSIDEIKNKS